MKVVSFTANMDHTEDTALVDQGRMKRKRFKAETDEMMMEYNENIKKIFPSNEDIKIKFAKENVKVDTVKVLSQLQKNFNERKNILSRLRHNNNAVALDDYYYNEELDPGEDFNDFQIEIQRRIRNIFLGLLDKFNSRVDVMFNYILRYLEVTEFSRSDDVNYSEVESGIKNILMTRDWLISQL